MANGQITRREIIEDEALKWGGEYANELQKAIDAHKALLITAKELAAIINQYRKADNQNAFIEAKNQERLATVKLIEATKAQEAAELSIEKIKQAKIQTDKAAIAAANAANAANNKLQATQKKGSELTAEEIVNQGILARNAKNHALANSKLATEYEKLTARARMAGTALQNILIAGKKVGETTAEYTVRLQRAQKEFDNLNNRVVAANRAISRYNDNVGNYPKLAIQGIRDLVQAFGLVTGIGAFVTITKQAFNIIKDFEAEMVNLAAISGNTRDGIAPLEAEIRNVAKASINSATDVAKLATELIKLGSTPEEAMKLLAPINNLSVALKATAEDAAGLVKGLLNAYGEGADQATRYTDVLAESANRSALDFEGLRNSFSYLAPTARTLGMSLEQTAAILGVLVDNNIKAESAGRLTSTAFGRLADQGISLEQALKRINDAQTSGAEKAEVLRIANEIFGQEAGKIGIILANNTEKVQNSTTAYENSAGALQELTDKQLKSVSAELEILSSAWEEYILNTNEATGGTQFLSGTLKFLSSNLDYIISGVLLAAGAWAAYKAALLLANLQTRLMALNVSLSTAAQAANTAATVTGTVAQGANATATTVATVAWQRFNTAVKANVLGIAIAGLLLLISTLNAYSQTLAEANEETKESTAEFLKNREQTSKNAASTKVLADRYDELKGKTKLNKEEQKEMNDILKALSKTYPEAVVKINNYGDAVELNTAKIRNFSKAQKEANDATAAVEIKKNTKLLLDLEKQQKTLTAATTEGGNLRKGVYVQEGQLYERLFDGREFYSRKLSLEETKAFRDKVAQNERAISDTKRRLAALKGLTEAEKASAKAVSESKKIDESGPRTIDVIDAEIKAQEELIGTLSDKSGKEGALISRKIAALKAEREQIYSTAKAEKDKSDNGLKRAKEVADAIYQLSQFRYQNEIDLNKRIVESDKSTLDERLDALSEQRQLIESKNQETLENDLLKTALEKDGLDKLSKEKFKIYKQDAENRIKLMLAGTVATKDMTNAEKLIFEKFYAEKKNLEEKVATDQQAIVDRQVADFKKVMDAQIKEQDTALNDQLAAENTAYQNRLDAIKKFYEQKKGLGQLSAKEQAAQNSEIEAATFTHEQSVFEIKKKASTDALNMQIKQIEDILNAEKTREDGSKLSTEAIAEYENQLSKYRLELTDIGSQKYEEASNRRIELEQQTNDRIKELGANLAEALIGLTNAIFDARIANIEADIEKNNEYYDAEIEKAGDNERKKEKLEEERDKKNAKLEKERRKEAYKAAVFNKVMSAAQIAMDLARTLVAINLAAAQMDALAAFGFGAVGASYRGLQIGLAIGVAAAQTATILATPLPKLKEGRKDGPATFAIVGDGGRSEIISNPDGSNPRRTPATSTLTYLKEHEMVHKSDTDYNRFMRASIITNVQVQNQKMNDYQSGKQFDKNYDKEMLEELKLTRKALEKTKRPMVVQGQKIDIPHSIWSSNNIHWS